jgi:hypothetical protein
MGVTRELTTVSVTTVSSFLLVESNVQDSCATSRDTRDAHSIPLKGVVYPRAAEGLTIL